MISTTTIIVYNNDEGGVSIVHPVVSEINPATGTHFTIEEIAQIFKKKHSTKPGDLNST